MISASVKAAKGDSIVMRNEQTIPVREGMHLFANDLLRTSDNASIGIIFQDGTRVSLGPNTEMRINRFVYQPADGKFGLLLKLMRGIMVYISGKIAHFSPDSVNVETPECIIGLRGTYFAISTEGS